MVPKKWRKWSPKGTPKVSQNHENGVQKPSQNRVPKKHRKITIFSTPECGQSVVNSCKIDDFHVLMLTTSWVSFWRCFGSPNGGQSHQKATSKKHQKNDAQNDPKMVPKGVPKWSQNRQKWGLGSILFQGWLPRGLQTPSRIDFGEVWRPFWRHFRQFFLHIFSDFCKHSLAACCKQNHSKSQGNTKRMQQKASKKQLLSSCRLALKSSLANVNELSGPR